MRCSHGLPFEAACGQCLAEALAQVDIERNMMITLAQLRQAVPYAGPRAVLFLQPLNETMAEFAIDTPARQAAFLAQCAHESGSFHYVREIASGVEYDHRDDLGNTRPEAIAIAAQHGTTPGPFWRGGGLLQLTGYDNYRDCGRDLGMDLVDHPELLEQPDGAARSAGWFWHRDGLNRLADAGGFREITRLINGGYNGLPQRVALWKTAKAVLGVA